MNLIKKIIGNHNIIEDSKNLNNINSLFIEINKHLSIFDEEEQSFIEICKLITIDYYNIHTDDSFVFGDSMKPYIDTITKLPEYRKDLYELDKEMKFEENSIEYIREYAIELCLNFFKEYYKFHWTRDLINLFIKKCFENDKYLTKKNKELYCQVRDGFNKYNELKRDLPFKEQNTDSFKKIKMAF